MKTDKPYVLIAGGTMGIGYELAQVFAKNGYNLVIVARNEAPVEAKDHSTL